MLKIAWDTCYCHSVPDHHRFPMEKYALIPEQLVYEGTVTDAHFFQPKPLGASIILETHDAPYWHKLKNQTLSKQEIRRIGFDLSERLVERERIILDGTVQTALYAIKYGISMNVAGGTHHAYTDRGAGFCLLNDLAVAANYLISHHNYHRILIVDLDVHQGDGTAQIFQNQDHVFTFSMHGAKNYPMRKETSDLDIALPDDTSDELYLSILKNTLPRLIDEFEPQFIFFQAGVDVLKTDKLGRLGMTIEGCKERDRLVLQTCKANHIPVSVTMGGGYSPKLSDIIEAHVHTYRLAQDIFF